MNSCQVIHISLSLVLLSFIHVYYIHSVTSLFTRQNLKPPKMDTNWIALWWLIFFWPSFHCLMLEKFSIFSCLLLFIQLLYTILVFKKTYYAPFVSRNFFCIIYIKPLSWCLIFLSIFYEQLFSQAFPKEIILDRSMILC